jgi:hypothetical protein
MEYLMQRLPAPAGSPYPHVGPNYMAHGEKQGYIYNPFTDKYRPKEETLVNMGLKEPAPKQPGMMDTIAPIAIGAGAMEIGKGIGSGSMFGKEGLLGGLKETVGGWFGGGTPVTNAGTVATPEVISAKILPEAVGTTPTSTGLLGGALSNAGSMAGSLGGLGALGGIAAGTYLGGEAALDMLKGREPGLPGRVTLGIATGGLSELANALFSHKSTRERQADVTKELLGRFKDDANYQNYVSGMREQFNSAPPDPSKPFFGGKYGSFEEYEKAGLDAKDLSGVGDNIDIFQQAWTNLDQATREKVTQGLIDAGLYYSADGGVKIKDEEKAMEIFNSIVNPTEDEVIDPTTGLTYKQNSINTI